MWLTDQQWALLGPAFNAPGKRGPKAQRADTVTADHTLICEEPDVLRDHRRMTRVALAYAQEIPEDDVQLNP